MIFLTSFKQQNFDLLVREKMTLQWAKCMLWEDNVISVWAKGPVTVEHHYPRIFAYVF